MINNACLDYGGYASKETRVRRSLARREQRALTPAPHLPLPPTVSSQPTATAFMWLLYNSDETLSCTNNFSQSLETRESYITLFVLFWDVKGRIKGFTPERRVYCLLERTLSFYFTLRKHNKLVYLLPIEVEYSLISPCSRRIGPIPCV